MTLYIIGDNNESNKTIVEFAEEHNLEYKFSNIISSSKSFLGAINEASHYDVTIIDILDLMIENEEIDKGIHTLKDIYNGIVIIYAPSASYNDSKLNICSRYGYENIVRDFLGARAKARSIRKSARTLSSTWKARQMGGRSMTGRITRHSRLFQCGETRSISQSWSGFVNR